MEPMEQTARMGPMDETVRLALQEQQDLAAQRAERAWLGSPAKRVESVWQERLDERVPQDGLHHS